MGDHDKPAWQPPASAATLKQTECRLGFRLPPLLRRIYLEVADGGFGPFYGVYSLEAAEPGSDTLIQVYAMFSKAPGWPSRLLPFCDWGCANWSCLDCRTDNGPVVTSPGEEPLMDTGRDLRSWLTAWLDGVDLGAEMFEPGPIRRGINPFTKQPMQVEGQGKARGRPWP